MLTDKPKTRVPRSIKNAKFPLLIYKRYHQVNQGLSVMLAMLGLLLIVMFVLIRALRSQIARGDVTLLLWFGVVFFVFGLARYMLTWLTSRVAYVQCTRSNVKIQTPFLPIVFSYKRIVDARPTSLRDIYTPDRQKGMGRRMLEEVWGETVIVVDLKGYPMSKKWLRMIAGPYLLTPKGTGFVFLVKDWMGLSRQMADGQEQWRARTSKSLPPAQRGLYSSR